MLRTMFLSVMLIGGSRLWAAVPTAPTQTVPFEVRDPKTKEVYFTGQDKISQEGKTIRRETSYFDLGQKEVQKERFLYEAGTLRTLDYNAANAMTGEETKVTGNDQGMVVVYKSGREAKAASGNFKGDKGVYLPNVASDLILQNWDSLMAGKPIKFELVIPSRMGTVPFQIVKRETLTVDNEVREVFALMPQNILIRALAPHLEFQFAKDRKIKLVHFPSSLPIKGSKDKMIEMVFKN